MDGRTDGRMDTVWGDDAKLAKPVYKPTAGIFTFQMVKKRKHMWKMIECGGFWNPLTAFTLPLFIYIPGRLLCWQTLPTENLLKVPPFTRRKTDTLNWRETKIIYHNWTGRSRWSKDVKRMWVTDSTNICCQIFQAVPCRLFSWKMKLLT